MIGVLAAVGFAAYLALPLIVDNSETVDACRIEQREQPLRSIDPAALEFCRDGVDEMEERTDSSLGFAMDYFRKAIEREPGYGSAIINLARSMVLLPTYDDSPDAGDCWYDSRISDQSDCYEAALKLLDLYIVNAPYIQNYIYGIKGYIYTQQGQWRLAAAQFDRAKNETPSDPDMWQWMSQFLASVGELDGALEGIETAFRLNPNSGVILDRYGVVLMWLGMYDEAAIRFNEAAEYPHVPFEASELVWSIRGQQWDEVRQLLARHAGSRRGGAAWIDDFLAGRMSCRGNMSTERGRYWVNRNAQSMQRFGCSRTILTLSPLSFCLRLKRKRCGNVSDSAWSCSPSASMTTGLPAARIVPACSNASMRETGAAEDR
jgi:hypothetical protein